MSRWPILPLRLSASAGRSRSRAAAAPHRRARWRIRGRRARAGQASLGWIPFRPHRPRRSERRSSVGTLRTRGFPSDGNGRQAPAATVRDGPRTACRTSSAILHPVRQRCPIALGCWLRRAPPRTIAGKRKRNRGQRSAVGRARPHPRGER